MLFIGTLLALDDALGLDQIAFLDPLWQAAVRPTMILDREARSSTGLDLMWP
jgi:hypothetical protein